MRALGLAGAPNARELGGLPVAGGRVRAGVLLRTSALGRLHDVDVAALAERKLAIVVDLRHVSEVQVAPADRLPQPAPEVRHIPIFDPAHPVFTFVSAVLLGHDLSSYGALRDEGTPGAMLAIYRWFVTSPAARTGFADAVRAILAADGRPVLYHCSAGKDRTGWLSAILLEALGADRDVIAEDYLATNAAMAGERDGLLAAMRRRGGEADPELIEPVLDARPEYLAAAYDEVEARYGGFVNYLRDGLGLGEDDLRQLRSLLTAAD
jgi:protein-tyrosine phosphatase